MKNQPPEPKSRPPSAGTKTQEQLSESELQGDVHRLLTEIFDEANERNFELDLLDGEL